MKNILKALFLVFACFGFAACSDEVGYIDPGAQGNPEKEIQGTYTGTWTQEYNGEVTTAQGTVTFTPTDNAYVTNVEVSCPDFNIELKGIANVVNFEGGYKFFNQEASNNGFGVVFDGTVINKEASIKFTLSVRSGRYQYLYNYTFAGN